MRYIRNIFDVFFGSVRRVQWTLVGMGIVMAGLRPDIAMRLIQNAFAAIWMGIQPFANAAIFLLIIFFGFRVMFKPFGKGNDKKKH